MSHRILVADDEATSRKSLKLLLASWGYEVEEAANGQEALEKAAGFRPAAIIADLVMPKLDGLGFLRAIREESAYSPVILLTGHGSIDTAVLAMKDGAFDYLTKPVDVQRLRLIVEKALEQSEAAREAAQRRRLRDARGLGKLVGTSRAMQEVYRLIELAAPTPAPILVLGESGTGKELVARTLHERSPRSAGPFVAVNCAAIPETLLESEIFGHERGAFTGALERRVGCFELAHGGTIFLDECAEMSPALQAKFLRILEEGGTLRRVGGKSEIVVDVRVLAATNKDPLKAMKDGTLREDLYYRLTVFSLSLPPLRDRTEDIPLLVQAFLDDFNGKYDKRVTGVDDAVMRTLMSYAWPGNVRELRNSIERAVIAGDGPLIVPEHLPAALAAEPRVVARAVIDPPFGITVEEAEKQLILKTLASVNNHKTRAAEILGISLRTLHNKLHRYQAEARPAWPDRPSPEKSGR
jgi:DNA-binding NtrC family response regulator